MSLYIVSFILLALLSANFLLTQKVIPYKYRPLPIISHLLGCMIMIPLTFFVLKNEWNISVPAISSEPLLKTIQNFLGAIVLGFILLELSHIKPSKQIIKVAGFSCLLPALGALLVCFILGLLSNIALTVALMCVFSISAVPVLYLYLKQLNADEETTKLLMGAAIFIDMVAWLAFGFVSSAFSWIGLATCIALGFIPFLLKTFIKEEKILKNTMTFMFFSLFLVLYVVKTYALVFAIIYLINLQKVKIDIENIIPSSVLQTFFNYIAIPLLFIFAALSISWGNVWNEIDSKEFILLLTVPIIFKVLGSWLGLKFAGWSARIWFGAFLLNIRGLTEIVFLNILLSSGVITASQYLALLLMSLIATIAPGLFRKMM